jgi:EAL domain-containing protein (putative c-di-GMP-specific phosphodiesterase class I)
MEMEKYLAQDVLSALMRHELKVYYQPKFDATTNHLKSAEVLVRWVKEGGSIVLPEQFLPVMEQTDVITILDWYVVE